MKKVTRIALIGVLTAVNVASRVYLQFLPNVKPVTALIILSTIAFGLAFGIGLAVTTVLVSGVLLGFGLFIPFQILAWVVIAVMTWILDRYLRFGKIIVFTVWAFLCGYIYGFFASLNVLLAGGPAAFLAYYINGFLFDTFHAAGNAVFLPLCYRALLPVFRRYAAQSRWIQGPQNKIQRSVVDEAGT